MSSIKTELSNLARYQCFFVFEPASIRISDNDIFLIGKQVRDMFDDVYHQVSENEDDIKMKILSNNIQKIGNMLDLLPSYDNVIITRFFDRIWRRYSYVSHLGESFLDLNTFLKLVPDYDSKKDLVIAQRIDINYDQFEEDNDDDDDDDDDDDKDSDDDDDANKDSDDDTVNKDTDDEKNDINNKNENTDDIN